MIIPKEKARELVEWSMTHGASEEVAKLFATRTIDEILKSTFSKKWYDKNNIIVADYLLNDYWQEVKQEIEKL